MGTILGAGGEGCREPAWPSSSPREAGKPCDGAAPGLGDLGEGGAASRWSSVREPGKLWEGTMPGLGDEACWLAPPAWSGALSSACAAGLSRGRPGGARRI